MLATILWSIPLIKHISIARFSHGKSHTGDTVLQPAEFNCSWPLLIPVLDYDRNMGVPAKRDFTAFLPLVRRSSH